ncbi:conserved hypothetical protein [Coccidioides posadasii str. Silveira]|uniref:Uncharacterized protein n=1 Tax=Coccidioides posadasii (strain RMSCC 757 / Silveira) TaxID=443226 RepID=E9DET3_COCPS|nr:conserved hypothetical protein [Coccidioides posadasii str. Silveira]
MAGRSNLPPLAPATENQGLVVTRDSGVNLDGHFFNNLTAAMEYIDNQAPHRRYGLQVELMNALMRVTDVVTDLVAHFYRYVERSRAWQHVTHANFEADFHDARKVTLDVERRRIDMQKIKDRLVATWGIDRIDAIWPKVESLWAAQKLRHTLNVYKDWDKFANNINSAVLRRLDATGAGHRRSLAILPGDYTTADKEVDRACELPSRDALRRRGLTIGNYGLLQPLALPQSSSSQRSIQDIARSPPTASSPRGLLEGPQSPRSSRDVPMGGMSMPHSRNVSGASIHSTMSIRSRGLETGQSQPPFGFTSALANPPSQSEAPKRRSERIAAMSAHQTLQGLGDEDESVIPPESDEEIPRHEREESVMAVRSGTCRCRGFEQQLLQKIKSTKTRSELELIRILEQLGKAFSDKKADIYLCYDHAKLMASKLGLQTRTLNREELLNRLAYIHRNRRNIGSVKTDDSTYLWFRLANRPARAEDALGIYKFKHQPIIPLVANMRTFDFNRYTRITGVNNFTTSDLQKEWETTGSVVIPQLMRWWNDKLQGATTTVLTRVNGEYDMYYHHQRMMGGRDNYGWLRTMYHSIGQQLMRQDPAYYLWYVLTRPDHAWKLISYPYYAKYAKPGDKTGFRHIDVNVPDAITTGRGVNMIQGSLTLTAEEPGDCTEILPGMHNHLEDWWGLVEERGLSTDGYVHRIKDTMYTKDDERKFGIRWTDVICKPGDVRITSPLLPHGAHGPCKKVRRTMLPWYVAIQEDHEHLEVNEAGTWSQLSAAHRDLVPGPSSPSGHSNRYASVPYRFPTAIQLQGLGAISDALVGRIRWDNPLVIEELDILFGPDDKKAQDFINNWRLKATRIALDAIVKTYQIEKKAFGNKSYWHCVHNNIDPVSVRPSPPPENLVEEEDHGDHY